MEFVTGMNRDRDGYEVAIALAEVGALAALVTDYYYGRSWPRLPSLRHRRADRLPAELVSVSNLAFYLQVLSQVGGLGRVVGGNPFRLVDGAIARRILREGERNPTAGLFVYSGYAYEAFSRLRDRRKVLFQFHPGVEVIQQAIDDDELRDWRPWQKELEFTDPEVYRIYKTELALADEFVCASSLTARGLVLAGVERQRISVVPYGAAPVPPVDVRASASRTMLFVGQGVQRKGLHLLAVAWRSVRPVGWKLRVVASRIDPAIRELLSACGDTVEVSGAVSRGDLERLYAEADVLVLPSLVEGFGLVLGEALAHGCRLLASDNTGIVDMDLPEMAATVVRAGSVTSLADGIRKLAESFDPSGGYRVANRSLASARSWAGFRARIRRVLGLGGSAPV